MVPVQFLVIFKEMWDFYYRYLSEIVLASFQSPDPSYIHTAANVNDIFQEML
jgi:hypothetical protein